MWRREYVKNFELTREDIQDMEYAQDDVYDYVSDLKTYDGLVQALGPVSGILGIPFLQYTAVGVAMTVTGLMAGMLDSEKQALKDAIQRGSRGLRDVKRIIDQNSQNIERVKVDFPYLEFSGDKKFGVIQGGGVLRAVLINGKWNYLD